MTARRSQKRFVKWIFFENASKFWVKSKNKLCTAHNFEVSQIWFDVAIQCPPAPQKSVLGFGLAQKLWFWGPTVFYLKIISKSLLPEAIATSKMLRFSIWGCQNDGEKTPNRVFEVNCFQKCIKILSKIHKHGAHLKNFWGISNLISRAYSVPSSTPKICPQFWASSKIGVLRSASRFSVHLRSFFFFTLICFVFYLEASPNAIKLGFLFDDQRLIHYLTPFNCKASKKFQKIIFFL